MNKKPLIDSIGFGNSRLLLSEGISKTSGKRVTFAEGILQRSDAENQNGRKYPHHLLLREAKNYSERFIKTNSAYGELDHPDTPVVSLKNASHVITEIWWEGKDLYGRMEILATPSGNIAKAILEAGKALGISSRGMGSVKELREGGVEVQDDFDLVAFDLVSQPSTHGAFMHSLNESVDYQETQIKKYYMVNKLIVDILRGE